MSAAPSCRACEGGNPVEAGERAAKTLGRIVAVFECDVDHARAGRRELAAGQREAPRADILAERHAAQDAEHALKMKVGRAGLLRRLFKVNRLGDVRLDVLDGALNPRDPIHSFSPFRCTSSYGKRAKPS